MGRKKLYSSDAERVAAYRARKARTEITVDRSLMDTLDEIADYLKVDKSVLVRSMIKFALTNRNYKTQGLTHYE